MATFNETRAATSRNNVAEQGIIMSNCSKTFQIFIFSLSLNESLVATFKEMCAFYSRKNIAEKCMSIPKLSETLRLL